MLFSLALNGFVPVDSAYIVHEPLQVEGLSLGNVQGYGVGSLGVVVAPSDVYVLGFSGDSYEAARAILGDKANELFEALREISFDDLTPNEATDLAKGFKAHLDEIGANSLEIAQSSLKSWEAFQTAVSRMLIKQGKKIGSQIHIDITFIDATGKSIEETIIADNLELLPNGKYKIIDAKTSTNEDLVSKSSLLSTCTTSQKNVYPLIDKIGTTSNTITKIEMYGKNMVNAFGGIRREINVEKGVDFYVNSDVNDFRQFIVRPLIK